MTVTSELTCFEVNCVIIFSYWLISKPRWAARRPDLQSPFGYGAATNSSRSLGRPIARNFREASALRSAAILATSFRESSKFNFVS
jgi:hypothetical protein